MPLKIYTCRDCGRDRVVTNPTRAALPCPCGGLAWTDGEVEPLPTKFEEFEPISALDWIAVHGICSDIGWIDSPPPANQDAEFKFKAYHWAGPVLLMPRTIFTNI